MRQNSMLSTFLKVTKAKYVPLGQVINFSSNCYRLMESVRRQIIRKSMQYRVKNKRRLVKKKHHSYPCLMDSSHVIQVICVCQMYELGHALPEAYTSSI